MSMMRGALLLTSGACVCVNKLRVVLMLIIWGSCWEIVGKSWIIWEEEEEEEEIGVVRFLLNNYGG